MTPDNFDVALILNCPLSEALDNWEEVTSATYAAILRARAAETWCDNLLSTNRSWGCLVLLPQKSQFDPQTAVKRFRESGTPNA